MAMWMIYLFQSAPAPTAVRFSQVGRVTLEYSERQTEKISPLCGCKEIDHWNSWHGIVFPAEELSIERAGDDRTTAFLIHAPTPSPIRYHNTFILLEARFLTIEVPLHSDFRPTPEAVLKLPESCARGNQNAGL